MLIYDSTNPFDIPVGVEAVAGYVDGIYAWPLRGWQRHSASTQIGIACFASTDDGDALDVETGDATPTQVPGWVKMRRAAGATQVWIYCNRANRAAVEAALRGAGIQPNEAALWVATLDGTQSVPPGPYPVAAIQYANSTLAGGHYDISITTTYGAASGVLEADLTPDQDAKLTEILAELRGNFKFANIDRIAAALGLLGPDTTDSPTIATSAQLAQAVTDLKKALPASGASSDLSSVVASQTTLNVKVDALSVVLLRIENALKGA